MNCVKCSTPIAEGKSFCPKCGHLNETAMSVQTKSLSNKGHLLLLLGSMLIFISFFLPFSKERILSSSVVTLHPGKKVIMLKTMMLHPQVLVNIIKNKGFYHIGESYVNRNGQISPMTSTEVVIANVLVVMLLIVPWLIFIGSIITSLLALTKNSKMVVASFLLGICGAAFLTVSYYLGNWILIPEIRWVFDIGGFVLIGGVVSLLIFAGKTYFDRTAVTN